MKLAAAFAIVAALSTPVFAKSPAETFCTSQANLHKIVAELRDMGVSPEEVLETAETTEGMRYLLEIIERVYVTASSLSPKVIYNVVYDACIKTIGESV